MVEVDEGQAQLAQPRLDHGAVADDENHETARHERKNVPVDHGENMTLENADPLEPPLARGSQAI